VNPSVKGEEIANRILLALPAAVLKQVLPHLKQLVLVREQVVCRLEGEIDHVLFPNRGLISLVKTMRDGRTVELGVRGIEGMTSPEALFGISTSLFDGLVQVPGSAFAINLTTLRKLTEQYRALKALLQRYIHVVVDQLAQTAACNRLHFLEQRCCRWLLIAHDSARADMFPLTQEFLSEMLGVRRSGVSIVAKKLQNSGLISYTRGRLTITDRAGLEALSCECYDSIREELDRLFATRKPRA
jgi:CRP-like cAMP-binding protein